MSSMSAQHTPGPWAFARYSKRRFGIGQAGEGAFFMLECVHDDTESPQAIGDARLMKSSPELLSVVEKFVDAASTSPDALAFSLMCDTFIEEARAAIAKATGSAS